MSEIQGVLPTRYRRLVKLASTQPLRFRRQAADAYNNCPRKLRKMARRFDRSVPMALEFFISWRDESLPQRKKIEEAPLESKVSKLLSDSFLLDKESQAPVMASIVQQSLARERTAFVERHYPAGERRLNRLAQQFVQQSDDVCLAQVEAYIEYLLYKAVARQQRMTVRDGQAGLLRRAVQCLRSGRQVRRLIRKTNARLKEIDSALAATEQSHSGLVARLFGLKIDYVTVLAARQEYEKALTRLSKKAAESPAKRLALYEKKTESIRANYLDAVPGVANLSDAQKAVKEIDEVLLAIFDLDKTQRNELMKTLQQYRQLVREREALVLVLSE